MVETAWLAVTYYGYSGQCTNDPTTTFYQISPTYPCGLYNGTCEFNNDDGGFYSYTCYESPPTTTTLSSPEPGTFIIAYYDSTSCAAEDLESVQIGKLYYFDDCDRPNATFYYKCESGQLYYYPCGAASGQEPVSFPKNCYESDSDGTHSQVWCSNTNHYQPHYDLIVLMAISLFFKFMSL
jgi:hypothetical protein